MTIAETQNGPTTLLSIRDLKVHFDLGGDDLLNRLIRPGTGKQVVKAVDGVSLDMFQGETLGLVGEWRRCPIANCANIAGTCKSFFRIHMRR